jgi:hypothetical protein
MKITKQKSTPAASLLNYFGNQEIANKIAWLK